MKPELVALVERAPTREAGRNLCREYLQARILDALQRSGAMVSLALQRGTALRFLHALPRFSEDLDFALERAPDRYDLHGWTRQVRSTFEHEGYAVDARLNARRVVHAAWLRFPGLLHELGLSPRREQAVAIKLEVDTRPPAGAVVETTLVRRHRLIQLQHHDRASLFAGKLHAVLARPYPKGRDLYDLVWYVSDAGWPPPNLALLQAALRQTGWDGAAPTESSWRDLVAERLATLDVAAAARDVAPFLERPAELALVTRPHLLALLAPPS